MTKNILIYFIGIAAIACTTKPKEEKRDILFSNLDTTVRPQQDFFQYANGGWIKTHPIPPAETSWGIGNMVQNEIYSRLTKINEVAAKTSSTDPTQQKIGNFWTSGMDTVQIENNKLQPILPLLDGIAAIKDKKSLLNIVADLKGKGISCFFADGVGQDDKNSEVMAYNLYQGGLGLPNRDYYFNQDERSTRIRNEYKFHLVRIFMISGSDSMKAIGQSDHVFRIETALAASSRKLADLRDPYANYNKVAISDLQKMSPSVDWTEWISLSGITNIDSVIVGQPEFFKALDQLLKKEPIENWKDYLKWHLLRVCAPYLHKAMVDENFNFYGRVLRGAEVIRPRWKRVLDAEERAMGEALGQLFVKEYFNENAKKRYTDMVEAIRDALKYRIQQLTWMSDSTKVKAYAKLSTIKKKVGYPDKWKDFSALEIDRGAYVTNVIHANQWWRKYNLDKLGKPVDRDEWVMTPQTYNAYYNPSNNEIVLPAGIFTVPGFRDEELDDALVYGYGGASTIGHEITHGFDDQGRQYNAEGNLKEWWTKEDVQNFSTRAEVMVSQFSLYMPIDTAHINGKATLGENIADLGGILLGLEAFKKTEQFKKDEKISGLTPLQRYFLGYSLGWLGHERKETLANQLLTDVHSPSKYRVNGPFVSVEDFYSVFQIKPEDPMYLADNLRVRIW